MQWYICLAAMGLHLVLGSERLVCGYADLKNEI